FSDAFTTSSIKVRSVTNCGSSSDRALSITGFVPTTPGAITGPTNACTFVGTGLNATYTIRKVANASSYVWTVPTGATIVSHPAGLGANDTSVVIAYDANFVSGTSISVQSAGCGVGTARSLAISLSGVPSTPSSISGPTNPCSFIANATLATYTIRPVANASSYNWTAPAGATIVSHPSGTGINDTIITVSFAPGFVSGNITVTSANGCGSNNSARSLALRTLYPSSTPTITGPSDPCPFIGVGEAVYTIRKIANATSYTWTVPSVGATAVHPNGPGINDTIIRVTFTAEFTTGAITARADAECGSSSTRTLTLTRKLSSTPGVLTTVQVAVCPNRQYTYTLPALPTNATGLLWEVPAGATLVSGQGTLSITVNYPSTAFSGVLKVWGTNNCGLSTSARSMTISLPLCPVAPRFATNSKGASLDATVEALNAVAMPNPTLSQFAIRIQSSDARTAIGLMIYDVNGRVLETKTGLQAGQTIQIGAAYRPGFYIAELIQGTMRKQIKLIKQ
ncbi:MAG TPA: T9SS type A sorting domain-containing protein, partial [Ferruginibacter sp.]|nr:T9SS type A sorting domain-containing protein [Ferruginibacter sp.]